ncbi:protein-glutamine gamma-glutamyltransferase K [Silurus asotus]|uniref:Protein-glutamine gamma-glutamyltransferase K n=1 Tax=Silurus asotus TaxID=30991 RepID=A0AAD5A4L5_SILAS|nr:protein-glutamine gamma-glutamyltransferase K [Silurus asotus]
MKGKTVSSKGLRDHTDAGSRSIKCANCTNLFLSSFHSFSLFLLYLSDGRLLVLSIDLLKSKTGQNRLEHHTERYQSDDLVVRRGQGFQMWIEFSRAFEPKSDKLHLELRLGPIPMFSRDTLVTVRLVEKFENKKWEAKIIEQKDTRIKVCVNSPPTAPIGRYELSLITWTPKGSHTYKRKPENDLYLLFNPWCKDDAVFMDNEDERNEYVLNDVGVLYYGNDSQIGARNWIFGQFADGVLAACLFILEKSQALNTGRRNPVNIVRVVSAMVNSPDDQGVLEGNWSNNYANGTSPLLWNGSVEILRQYHKSGGKPVKYGQCWVFSGVTNTVLRCLGIPTRSVTNFSSAHDTDVSLTTDVYFDEKMNPIEKLNNDSIWYKRTTFFLICNSFQSITKDQTCNTIYLVFRENQSCYANHELSDFLYSMYQKEVYFVYFLCRNFHVWNECWMARSDLPDGMGGWQVVDATPQETSQGIFCCGPIPLAAIRDGLVYMKYDAPFVFAEVNSDRIIWQRQSNGTFTQISCEKNVVGKNISTKAVGSDLKVDITHLYKHPEGSEAERIAVETASSYGSRPNTYPCAVDKDVTLAVTVDEMGQWVGEDARLSFIVNNGGSETRSIKLYCQVAIMYYTGVLKGTVKKDEISLKLNPKEVKTQVWTVPYDQYKDQLVDHSSLMLTVLGRVTETKQVLAIRHSFRLRTPDIILTPVGDAMVGTEMAVKITFKNPLSRVLKNVTLRIQGLGLLKVKDIRYGDIGSLMTITLTEKFTPNLSGLRKLLASLDCQQLTQVHGVADILVKEK